VKSGINIHIEGDAKIAGIALFSDLKMDIKSGQWTALLGPSGAGKSTILRLFAGIDQIASFHGSITCDDGKSLAGRVSYMAQDDLLLPWATVRQNINLGKRLRAEPEDWAKSEHLITAVGLSDHVDKYPSMLSGGERQRVALARTLIEDRPVVLLDEPFSALDVRTRADMQELAARHFQDRTVLLVTHDPYEAVRLCGSIYCLQGQKLQQSRHLEPPFPKMLDDKDLFALQAELLSQIRAGA
jgi:putative hydroxymethylpyrimidine transport system ATP-binding protein